MSDSFVTPRTIGLQAPLSMGFLWQEHWSGLLLPSPEDIPDPGTELTSPALEDGFFTNEPLGKPKVRLEINIVENWQTVKIVKIEKLTKIKHWLTEKFSEFDKYIVTLIKNKTWRDKLLVSRMK